MMSILIYVIHLELYIFIYIGVVREKYINDLLKEK